MDIIPFVVKPILRLVMLTLSFGHTVFFFQVGYQPAAAPFIVPGFTCRDIDVHFFLD